MNARYNIGRAGDIVSRAEEGVCMKYIRTVCHSLYICYNISVSTYLIPLPSLLGILLPAVAYSAAAYLGNGVGVGREINCRIRYIEMAIG
jgi:hypothetical protein